MRLISVLLILLLGAAGSCKEEARPQGILTKDQMADWMLNIYLAEGRTLQLRIPRDSAYKIFLPYQDTLMRKRGIADSTLTKSYQYYMNHPVEFEAIYDIVIDSLSLREQRMVRPNP